ncbi:MAG: response regulator [Eubacteriales bacterium]|nr:response regulator [Eubacteriales bacterium]
MTKIVLIDEPTIDIPLLRNVFDQLNLMDSIQIFTDEWDALVNILESDKIEGIIINVDLACCDGLRMIKVLESINPDHGFVFVSDSGRYGVEAFNYNVVDYFKKPYTKDKLKESISKLKERYVTNQDKKIYIQTFGSFEIFVDGKLVPWGNSKPKELLAFLVDARGANVSSLKIQRTLWPDSDAKKSASSFHTTLHSLRRTLIDLKLDELLESSRGSLRINTDMFECDFYEFENEIQLGTKESLIKAFELYQGHYLENNCFEWSSFNRIRLKIKFEEISNFV